MKIPVSKPSITNSEMFSVLNVMQAGWVSSQAPVVQKFEEEFAKYIGVKYAIACSSGTTALQLALESLNLEKGSEVILPEFTMIACAWAVEYAGLKPVFVDCGDDFLIDVTKIESVITPKTKAIMPVHIYGRTCNMDAITKIAKDYHLFVVEDCAEATGARYKGKMHNYDNGFSTQKVGAIGDIGCFSLFANKIITSGEGGICTTNDLAFAIRMRSLRAMSFSHEHDFLHKERGHNFRMTAMQASLALAQLSRIDEMITKRKVIESVYSNKLKTSIQLPEREVVWMYDILLKDFHQRETVRLALKNASIETRHFFKPMSMQPMYLKSYKHLKAFDFSQRGLYLPTFVGLTNYEIDQICTIINKVV